MADQPNGITKFWQELKRRKVVKVIVIYASTTFILLQLVSILIEPLHLPQWVMTFFIVLLVVGFPIAVIFSWIFDVTPEGIKVTKPISDEANDVKTASASKKKTYITNGIIAVLLIVVAIFAYPKIFKSGNQNNVNPELEKSIAVLPFIDDSPEEGNAYIINGLMDEILNKLQKIEDLKVKSRTSVETYRESKKTIKEISKELNANYILEGSGLKIGNKIKITLQLIEGQNGNHIWSNPYMGEVDEQDFDGIFELIENVSFAVANELEAIVSPEEVEIIKTKPTDNLTAWDYYLKGSELFRNDAIDEQKKAINYFEKALEHDNEFALAYACLAITYFYLDEYLSDDNPEKTGHSTQINNNADKALLYDPLSEWSLVAKASYYLSEKEYEMAIPYMEKALEYNPNSSMAIINLIWTYKYLADYEKSLEYNLMAINNNMPSMLSNYYDVSEKYYDYFMLANNFGCLGFFEEALNSFDKSLEIAPDFMRGEIDKVLTQNYISGNYQQLKEHLIDLIQKDTANNTEAHRFLAYSCYKLRDFNAARNYYNKYFELVELEFDEDTRWYSYRMESDKLAVISSKLGETEKSIEHINRFIDYIKIHEHTSEDYHLCAIYSLKGNTKKAIEQMKLVAQQNVCFGQIQSFKDDPIFDNIRPLPKFQKILAEIETKFWANHERIKKSLKEKGLL